MAIRKFESEFWFGDVVYLRVHDEPRKGMVSRVQLSPGGSVLYTVTWGDRTDSYHYAAELAAEYEPDFGPAA